MADTNKTDREEGIPFRPKFDGSGLLTAVVQDARSSEVLMVAHMNAEALQRTRESGLAHFYSRSRNRLWQKGETSGNSLHVERILVDCDQDALILKCRADGPACHTGRTSCFYRELQNDTLISTR